MNNETDKVDVLFKMGQTRGVIASMQQLASFLLRGDLSSEKAMDEIRKMMNSPAFEKLQGISDRAEAENAVKKMMSSPSFESPQGVVDNVENSPKPAKAVEPQWMRTSSRLSMTWSPSLGVRHGGHSPARDGHMHHLRGMFEEALDLPFEDVTAYYTILKYLSAKIDHEIRLTWPLIKSFQMSFRVHDGVGYDVKIGTVGLKGIAWQCISSSRVDTVTSTAGLISFLALGFVPSALGGPRDHTVNA